MTQVPNNVSTTVKQVTLHDNLISKIERDSLTNLTQLERLWLYRNVISNVEPGAFRDLTKLKDLSLRLNRLTTIRVGTFEGLVKLEWLDLRHNSIRSIEAGTFSQMPRLKQLELASNDLTTLLPDVFGLTKEEDLQINLRLDISDNPLQCDSRLDWIKKSEQRGFLTWMVIQNASKKPDCANYPGADWHNITLTGKGS